MGRALVPLIVAALLGPLAAAESPGWTPLKSSDGGFPEPNVVYHRMAVDLARLEPGTRIKLDIVCPKARYFSLNVYDQGSGKLLAFAEDRRITGSTDLAGPACSPGRTYGLSLVPRARAPGRGELAVPGLAARKGTIELWFRAYLGQDVRPPEVSLTAPDGRGAGPPASVPVREFPKGLSLLEAARRARLLPPEPEGGRLVFAPTEGSGWFPNGYGYLFSRLDATNPLVPRRFKRLALLGGEQFAVVRFRPPATPGRVAAGRVPEARYWSICMYDAPSSTLLRDEDGGAACLSDREAGPASDGTVSVVLGSPRTAAYARAKGAHALPVVYPRRIVAMPLLLLRVIPNDPSYPGAGACAPEGRFYPVESLDSVLQETAGKPVAQ